MRQKQPKGSGVSFEIRKDVPQPPRTRKRPLKYPWDKMEIGDSIFLESDDFNKREAVRCSAYIYGKRHGKTFESRVTANGIGVWRKT